MTVCLYVLKCVCQSAPCDFVVTNMVSEFAELIQNEVARIFRHLVTCVVDLLHIALGTRGAHNVGGVSYPLIKPIESLL